MLRKRFGIPLRVKRQNRPKERLLVDKKVFFLCLKRDEIIERFASLSIRSALYSTRNAYADGAVKLLRSRFNGLFKVVYWGADNIYSVCPVALNSVQWL